MADAISDFLFTVLLYGCIAIFLGAPLGFVVFFKDKLSFWPRPKWTVMFYKLKDGKKVDDTGHVKEEDCILMEKRTSVGWKIISNKIPWFYVKQGFVSGFNKDYAAVALSLKGKVVRLVEIADGGKDPQNYILMDIPKELDSKEIDGAISGMGQDLRETIRSEFTRPQNDNWFKAHAFEIIGVIVLIVVIVLTLNWNQTYTQDITTRSTSAITVQTDRSVREIVFACGGKFINDTELNSSTIQNKQGNIQNFLLPGS